MPRGSSLEQPAAWGSPWKGEIVTTEKVRELHEKRPFEPFVIHTADGRTVRVIHPEFLLRTVGGRTVYVHTGKGDRVEIIDLLLVTKLTTGSTNGKQRKNGRH
jgi:hypothetical protein